MANHGKPNQTHVLLHVSRLQALSNQHPVMITAKTPNYQHGMRDDDTSQIHMVSVRGSTFFRSRYAWFSTSLPIRLPDVKWRQSELCMLLCLFGSAPFMSSWLHTTNFRAVSSRANSNAHMKIMDSKSLDFSEHHSCTKAAVTFGVRS